MPAVTGQELLTRRLFLALVAVLPLHTVYFSAWISWKPWLILLGLIVLADLLANWRWVWDRRATLGVSVFLATILASLPGSAATDRFWRLWLALVAGALLLLITSRRGSEVDRILRVVFWSGAALALTGFLIGLITNGVFGERLVGVINDLPGIDRVNKPAYRSGFVALTNWHQDPGYAALWANVWFVLAGRAWLKGLVKGPTWLGPLVLGGLGTVTVLTLSRTGWVGLGAGVVALVLWGGERRQAGRLTMSAIAVMVLLVGFQFVVDRPDAGNDMATSVWFRLANITTLGQIEVGEGEGIPGDPGDNRIEVWSAYWVRFVESPVLGTGLGAGWSEEDFQEPHSLWLQLLAESGLIGVAGFTVLMVTLARTGRAPDSTSRMALLVLALASLTQTILFEPVLWFVLGLWHAGGDAKPKQRKGLRVCRGLPIPGE